MIGYEFELLVREGDIPLSKSAFLKFHAKLAERGWKPEYDSGTHGLIGSKKDGFFVTTDDGVCIMEVNAPPQDTIVKCHDQIQKLLFELQAIYEELGCSIIGLSTFPGSFDIENKSCKQVCLVDQCCEKSYIKYLNSQRFNKFHHALFIIAADQVWLDVEKSDLMNTWNAFNAISGLLLALFGNGPISNNQSLNGLEGRDIFWRKMLNTSQVPGDDKLFGMPEKPFISIFDYFNFILDCPFYFGARDGKGFVLKDPTRTYRTFFAEVKSEAILFDGTSRNVSPTVDDFLKLHQLTFPHVRIKYTIKKRITLKQIMDALERKEENAFSECFEKLFLECRGISAQMQSYLSAGPALLTGLQECREELNTLIGRYPYEFWYTLYFSVLTGGLEALHQNISVAELSRALVEIARSGLRKRRHGEERFLAVLDDRIKQKKNPAQDALTIWQKGGLESLYQARDFKSS